MIIGKRRIARFSVAICLAVSWIPAAGAAQTVDEKRQVAFDALEARIDALRPGQRITGSGAR